MTQDNRTQEQLQAVVILTSLPREQAAEFLSALPQQAAKEVLRLAEGINAILPPQKQAWLAECLGHFMHLQPDEAVRFLSQRLLGEEALPDDSDAADVQGLEAFEALQHNNDVFLETLTAKTDIRMLALAMRGASKKLREALIPNLTLRRASELHHQIALLSAATEEQIIRAQKTILQTLPVAKE